MSAFFAPSPVGVALAQHAQRLRADELRRDDEQAADAAMRAQHAPVQDHVELSDAALAAAREQDRAGAARRGESATRDNEPAVPAASNDASDRDAEAGAVDQQSIDGRELSEQEQAKVRELKQRDAEVRRHEAAHQAAAGPYAAGGPSFEYERGPDGHNYAVGGEVQIDTSPIEGDPEATIRKMQQVRAAALAPAEPSAQDRKVAAQAAAAAQQAQAELATQRRDGGEEESEVAAFGVEPREATRIDGFGARGLRAYEQAAKRTHERTHIDTRA
ncbi:MAG: hypothetical protein D6744_11220 [Planctomycetota bacterium]|nr:MAG: hypothetical protein D6744_11220 [Planctomycetota bacterium]